MRVDGLGLCEDAPDTGRSARDEEVMLKHNLRGNEADGGMLLRYAGGGPV